MLPVIIILQKKEIDMETLYTVAFIWGVCFLLTLVALGYACWKSPEAAEQDYEAQRMKMEAERRKREREQRKWQ